MPLIQGLLDLINRNKKPGGYTQQSMAPNGYAAQLKQAAQAATTGAAQQPNMSYPKPAPAPFTPGSYQPGGGFLNQANVAAPIMNSFAQSPRYMSFAPQQQYPRLDNYNTYYTGMQPFYGAYTPQPSKGVLPDTYAGQLKRFDQYNYNVLASPGPGGGSGGTIPDTFYGQIDRNVDYLTAIPPAPQMPGAGAGGGYPGYGWGGGYSQAPDVNSWFNNLVMWNIGKPRPV